MMNIAMKIFEAAETYAMVGKFTEQCKRRGGNPAEDFRVQNFTRKLTELITVIKAAGVDVAAVVVQPQRSAAFETVSEAEAAIAAVKAEIAG
jgi:ABC-type branched-subunit amino acid transport system substrate-binding protein